MRDTILFGDCRETLKEFDEKGDEMTDLADYLSEPIREEHIRQVRKKIKTINRNIWR